MTENGVIKKPKKTKKVKKLVQENPAELADVYKEKEFNDFVEWLSLPPLLKGRSVEYLEKLGITDEYSLALLEIKNKTQFAEKYKVENSTLTEWSKKAQTLGLLERTRDFFRAMTSNVYEAFYFETLRNGDASRVRLWEEIFNGKQPEAPPLITQNILTPQFNQVIAQIRVENKEKIRKLYEQQIRQSAKKVPSSE